MMKKSRVERFKDLHREIAADAESSVENSNLSDFAKRLNEIDSQFEQIQTSEKDNSEQAVRARKHAESDSEYLQNFLDEVKAYNVKKGYRHHEDTQTNLLNEIREELRDSEVEYFNNAQETEGPDDDDEVIQNVDLNIEDEEESLPTEAKLFGEGILEEAEKPEDISNAVQELVDEIEEGASDDNSLDKDRELEELDFQEDTDSQEFSFENDTFDELSLKEELLSQTQTLQHKIIDQERNIDEMSEKMARTNRLLNVILSFLIFAIIVIILIIVKQFLQF